MPDCDMGETENEPGTRNQKPGTKNQEPKTRNQKPGTSKLSSEKFVMVLLLRQQVQAYAVSAFLFCILGLNSPL
jgi:hypothetical protein